MEAKKLAKILKDTKRIIKHHNELTVAKGDHFNLFSVLKIETRENKTHSAFLAELLNPEGSHRMGDVFLQHFITTIEHSKSFETKKAKVKVERSIGAVDLKAKKGEDKSKASGGRIDICLEDIKGNIISIENKIHALDQKAQIQRYYNHQTAKNTVYYLTLKGTEPIKDSKLNLISREDFYNISYRDYIVKWLERCLKEVPNFTGLRESINQYILLIKKLTNTLDAKHEKELGEIMLDNLLESEYISNNYQRVLNTIRENFRTALANSLCEKLDSEIFNIVIGDAIDKQYAQLWIYIKGFENPQLCFGVETFSGVPINHGNIFVGILDQKAKESDFLALKTFTMLNEWWPHHQYLEIEKDMTFNLGDHAIIKLIRNNESDSFKTLVSTCAKQIIEFVNTNTKYIKEHLNRTK
ncbi:hypothetical protein ES692_15605 [Psychroserpens burtonensis]|uniref:PD-(D/E)XK nuclease family protein n=1 Tax=Psychroserpens burtonensis TaxID=49278 RepID=A0A5C7B4K1_9FLAO|nr:PD-(D/E)XK nuclease family protein [Psychroserpens burtonensis]TXE15703.1 hypothetical protein ES692_15605 [Psychroserpens burtonensis]